MRDLHVGRELTWPAAIASQAVGLLGMLEPHELARAQFGRFADQIDLSAATTKAKKVHLIGNSVCPEVAEAVVAANLPKDAASEAVA